MNARAGLTKRQAEALTFISGFIAAHGYSPSYAEIGSALGVSSKSGIHRILRQLRDRRAVDFLDGKRRSIYVPEDA